MKIEAPAPGLANRVAKAELWIRDADGRGLRPVTMVQAERLVSGGAAFPIVASSGKWKEVRLKSSQPLHLPRTFTGWTATALANPAARFDHNEAVCRTWKHCPGRE